MWPHLIASTEAVHSLLCGTFLLSKGTEYPFSKPFSGRIEHCGLKLWLSHAHRFLVGRVRSNIVSLLETNFVCHRMVSGVSRHSLISPRERPVAYEWANARKFYELTPHPCEVSEAPRSPLVAMCIFFLFGLTCHRSTHLSYTD